jgi:hypothetical protein
MIYIFHVWFSLNAHNASEDSSVYIFRLDLFNGDNLYSRTTTVILAREYQLQMLKINSGKYTEKAAQILKFNRIAPESGRIISPGFGVTY